MSKAPVALIILDGFGLRKTFRECGCASEYTELRYFVE